MKKMKIFSIASMVLAAGSAFVTKPQPLAAGDYQSTKNGSGPCVTNTVANQSQCQGAGAICTINGISYFKDASCGTPLRFN